jgi:hypothetical protein
VREINRAFAAHFRRPTLWQKFLDSIFSLVGYRRRRFSLHRIDPSLPEDSDLTADPINLRSHGQNASPENSHIMASGEGDGTFQGTVSTRR